VAAVPVLPPRAAGRKGGAAASRWQADHLIDGRQAVHQVFVKVFYNLHKKYLPVLILGIALIFSW
jgi:hypothetical protein